MKRTITIDKEEWEWFKEMQEEGRTRVATISTFRTRKNPEEEIELEVRE